MPLSAFGTVLYSMSSSMSPYSLSVARYAPEPSLTSSSFSTVQCFFASAVQPSILLVRSSGASFARSAGLPPFAWIAHPCQPSRSLPLKSGVNPFGGSAALSGKLQRKKVSREVWKRMGSPQVFSGRPTGATREVRPLNSLLFRLRRGGRRPRGEGVDVDRAVGTGAGEPLTARCEGHVAGRRRHLERVETGRVVALPEPDAAAAAAAGRDD